MVFAIREASRYLGAPVSLYRFRGRGAPAFGPYGFHNGDTGRLVLAVEEGTEIYEPWPIKNSRISWTGNMDKSRVTITLAMGTPLDDLFGSYPPSQVINVSIREGHMDDDPIASNFPIVWLGRLTGAGPEGHEMTLNCLPYTSALGRAGLQRAWQIGCPHALYGPSCGASKAAGRLPRVVEAIGRNRLRVTEAVPDRRRMAGGTIEWVRTDNGLREMRTIVAAPDDATFVIRGTLPGLAAGVAVDAYLGCNHQLSDCALHNNVLNYGGQPLIPLVNPLSEDNQFY